MTLATAIAPESDASAPRGVTVERIDRLEDFVALRVGWDDLYARDPEAQFFLSWTFLAGACEANPGRWFVLVARGDDGAVIGLMPLAGKLAWSDTRRQLRNELQFGGRLFWSDYGGLLCLPEHEEKAIAAITEALTRLHWARLTLKGFCASPRRFGLFMGAFVDERFEISARSEMINDGTTDNLVAAAVELPHSFDAFLTQRLSANSREKLRRALRRFERMPGMRLTVADATTRNSHVAILERLWSAQWGTRKGDETPRIAAQYGRIVARAVDDGTMRLSILWKEDAPICALGNFIDAVKRDVLFFVSGRDPARDDLDIGRVLHGSEIRWAIAQGFRRYDFLRGNEPYKYRLGATDSRLRYPIIRTATGTNLGGRLDAASLGAAMGVARDFVAAGRLNRAKICCRQILTADPGHADASALLAKAVAAL